MILLILLKLLNNYLN